MTSGPFNNIYMLAYMRRKSAMAKYQRKKCTHQRISSYNIRVYRMAYILYEHLYIIRCHAAIMQAPRVRAIGSTVNNDM